MKVPKSLKNRLWDTTFGAAAGEGKCYVCNTTINSKTFEAGHVVAVAKGGPTTLTNLKCICSPCNKSMGTQNLEIFKAIYFPEKPVLVDYDELLLEKIKSLDQFIYRPPEDHPYTYN
jgi:hypothetical protein